MTYETQTEWQDWQNWHKEFASLTGLDINDHRCDTFVMLTKKWGESFARLRAANVLTRLRDGGFDEGT